ncbi:HEXXH motif domain-containing protein [Frankia sp. AgB1.9]|uniref:HEXXH motif domain-containing protein n=1 Tax=Frankia sp. AgB1.9 TaxID=1836968 RepID=UPI001932BAEE|nr:HEXXH motif domain-containing protein [Frankia sp. AgB1.9]MBL7549384.1 HEXXH motif domain-containing protein [Frankia sp. AgB1.9]
MNAPHPARAHRLARAHFDVLAAGGGGIATITELRSMQLSKRILLVYAVAEVARTKAPGVCAAAGLDEAQAVLAACYRASPEPVAEVLRYPSVGAWAMQCLRQLVAPDDGSPDLPRLAADLGHFGALAAAAAVRAGVSFETTVRVRESAVMLPTLGLVRVEAPDGWARARGSGGTGRVEILHGGATATVTAPTAAERPPEPVGQAEADGRWLPLRRLRSTANDQRIDLALDDIDPFRGFAGLPPAGRVPTGAVAAWQDRLNEAWAVLVGHDRDQADAIAASARCLVPLEAGPERWKVSATSADSSGAFGLTTPEDGLSLAVTLVHEFQHTKLLALIDVVELCEPGDEVHYAPWRPDPRPVSGLLHGAYAYLGVTDFWRRYRSAARGAPARLAQFEFARWQAALRRTLPVLRTSRLLTALGAEFVAGMAASSEAWSDEQVPPAALALAQDIGAVHRIRWRLRNLRPDVARVTAAAEAWLAARSNPDTGPMPLTVVGAPRGEPPEPHVELAHLRLLDPARFDALVENPAELATALREASRADLLLVAMDYAGAARAYQSDVARAPDRVEPWTGLAVAHRRLAVPEQRVLVSSPEVVLAVHRRIRELGGADARPEALSAWLTAAGRRPT